MRGSRHAFEQAPGSDSILARAVVEGSAERFQLGRPGGACGECAERRRPFGGGRLQLEPVLADVGQFRNPDDFSCALTRAAADAGDECVARSQTPKLVASRVRDLRVRRIGNDWRKCSVHVEEDGREPGFGGEAGQRVHALTVVTRG